MKGRRADDQKKPKRRKRSQGEKDSAVPTRGPAEERPMTDQVAARTLVESEPSSANDVPATQEDSAGRSPFRSSLDYLGVFLEILLGTFTRRARAASRASTRAEENRNGRGREDQPSMLRVGMPEEAAGLSSLFSVLFTGGTQSSDVPMSQDMNANDITLYIQYSADPNSLNNSSSNLVLTFVYYIYEDRPKAVSLDELNEKIPLSVNASADLNDCPICMEEIRVGDSVRELPCKHTYHNDCVDEWITKYVNECPLCRNIAVPTAPSSVD